MQHLLVNTADVYKSSGSASGVAACCVACYDFKLYKQANTVPLTLLVLDLGLHIVNGV